MEVIAQTNGERLFFTCDFISEGLIQRRRTDRTATILCFARGAAREALRDGGEVQAAQPGDRGMRSSKSKGTRTICEKGLARIFDCGSQTLVLLRDKTEALQYRARLVRQLGPEASEALVQRLDQALADPHIKWKSRD